MINRDENSLTGIKSGNGITYLFDHVCLVGFWSHINHGGLLLGTDHMLQCFKEACRYPLVCNQ